MGMTLKELLTKGEGTLSAQEAKALAAQCRMDLDTLYTLLEERGIKIQEEEIEPSLDVEGIMAEVENAENNNDDLRQGYPHKVFHHRVFLAYCRLPPILLVGYIRLPADKLVL